MYMKGTAPLLNCRNCSTVGSVQICGWLCKIIGPRLTRFAVLSVFLLGTRSLLGWLLNRNDGLQFISAVARLMLVAPLFGQRLALPV